MFIGADLRLRTVLAGIKVHSPGLMSIVLAAWSKYGGAEAPAPIRALLADPNTIARAGLKAVLMTLR